MAQYTYDFAGADTAYSATTFPNPAGVPALAPVVGDWRRLANRANSTSSPAILAADFDALNVNISVDVSPGGGDAIYLRVGGPEDWIRAVVRYSRLITHTTTLYEVRQGYGGNGTGDYQELQRYLTYAQAQDAVNGSTAYFPASYNGRTTNGRAYATGYTIENPDAWTDTRKIYLQASVAGGVTTLGTVDFPSTLHNLRVRTVANKISVYLDGATAAALTATSSAGSANTSHGIGRALIAGDDDPMSGTALDNLVVSTNTAPNAPVLTNPANDASINVTATNRFSWSFSDADSGDTQSAAAVRYRSTTDTDWTTVALSGPNAFWDAPPATFTSGVDYEWQVATTDAAGEQGPYSTSSFFTGVQPPAGPAITAPTSGADVSQHTIVTWSATAQDAYQLRRVADNAGAANAAVVYFDTGEVTGASGTTDRSLSVDFDVNDRWEHIQLRVKVSGLWGPWTDVRVHVTYTLPPTPAIALTPDPVNGRLLVTITNPAPAAGQPAVAYNEVWVDDGNGLERRVTNLAANALWIHPTPVGGRDYDGAVQVVTYAVNGTTASND